MSFAEKGGMKSTETDQSGSENADEMKNIIEKMKRLTSLYASEVSVDALIDMLRSNSTSMTSSSQDSSYFPAKRQR
jgi:hypothetical protein